MANNKIYIIKAVKNNFVIFSITADLGNNIRFFKFVIKAFKLLRFDIFDNLSLVTVKYYDIFRYFDVYNKCFEPVFNKIKIDKRKKFTNVVSVNYNINLTNIK